MSEVHASLGRSHGDLARQAEKDPLGHQTLQRALAESEIALADALEDIYSAGAETPAAVAEELTRRGVRAPHSLKTEWTAELLGTELTRINASLDAAYNNAAH